jgi:hypothetical protein
LFVDTTNLANYYDFQTLTAQNGVTDVVTSITSIPVQVTVSDGVTFAETSVNTNDPTDTYNFLYNAEVKIPYNGNSTSLSYYASTSVSVSQLPTGMSFL